MKAKALPASCGTKIIIMVISFFAGIINALFGTGAGMVYIIMLSRLGMGRERNIFAASTLSVLALSLVSVIMYMLRGELYLKSSISMCIVAALGGMVGALLLGKINPKLLRILLAALLIFGGIRMVVR